MVFNMTGRKSKRQQQSVNVAEAFNLWDMLSAKYQMLEMAKVWQAAIHDQDFVLIVKDLEGKLTLATERLEQELQKFSIKGPERPRESVVAKVNTEIITDELIAAEFLARMQESVEMLLKSIKTSTTNDQIRALFSNMLTATIGFADMVIKYQKAKGWIGTPPPYPNIPVAAKERLDAGEAFHLWDHLTYRYDNLNQTLIWQEYVHDGDFKVLLKKGQGSLQKQATILEKELSRFGIPLPKQPARSIPKSPGQELLEDQYIFRELLLGIQGATSLHAQAFKRCTTNDRVRGIFKKLLLEELDMINDLILFGKVKGWLHPVPNFALQ